MANANHSHKSIPPVDATTIEMYEVCECGATRQVLDRHGKVVQDSWHLCDLCCHAGYEAYINFKHSWTSARSALLDTK